MSASVDERDAKANAPDTRGLEGPAVRPGVVPAPGRSEEEPGGPGGTEDPGFDPAAQVERGEDEPVGHETSGTVQVPENNAELADSLTAPVGSVGLAETEPPIRSEEAAAPAVGEAGLPDRPVESTERRALEAAQETPSAPQFVEARSEAEFWAHASDVAPAIEGWHAEVSDERPTRSEALELSPRHEAAADAKAGAAPRDRDAMPPDARARGSVSETLGLFLVVVTLFIVGGPALQQTFGLMGIMAFQLACVLGIPLLYLLWARLPVRETLGLRRPSLSAIAGSAVLGASLWYVPMSALLPLQNLILPPSEAFLKEREALFDLSESLGGWAVVVLLAAITPAICEEIFFRGVLLSRSRPRLGDWTAILLVSVLFSLFHMNPYQLSITFLLGAVMGWLRVRTGSILCSMIFHLLNNSVVLLLARGGDEALPLWAAAPLLAGIALGFELVHRSPRQTPG